MPPHPLPLSRMLAVSGTPPPHLSPPPLPLTTPLGGALTWDPLHGPLPHATPELAALHVASYNLSHNQPDEVTPQRGIGDPHPLRARILCVSETVTLTDTGLPGLSLAAERRLLAEARAMLAAQKEPSR